MSVFVSLCICVHVCVSWNVLPINRSQETVICFLFFLTFSSKSLRRMFTIIVLHIEFLIVFSGHPSCEGVRVFLFVCVCVYTRMCFFMASGETGKLTSMCSLDSIHMKHRYLSVQKQRCSSQGVKRR